MTNTFIRLIDTLVEEAHNGPSPLVYMKEGFP